MEGDRRGSEELQVRGQSFNYVRETFQSSVRISPAPALPPSLPSSSSGNCLSHWRLSLDVWWPLAVPVYLGVKD